MLLSGQVSYLGSWEHTFLSLERFCFSLYPWKSQIKQSPPLEFWLKLCMLHPSERPKTKTPGYFTWIFLALHWKFHVFLKLIPRNSALYFLNTPGNPISSATLPLFGFFPEKSNLEYPVLVQPLSYRIKITYRELLIGFFHKLVSVQDVGHNMLHLHVAQQLPPL